MAQTLINMGQRARKSARVLAGLKTREKDAALLRIADLLEKEQSGILAANEKDLKAAKEAGISTAMQDRLLLTPERIADMAGAVRQVASLPDPIGQVLDGGQRPNGMHIVHQRVPLGVVAVIYEARPNVTIDVAVLCLKSGNACILRGGSEAIHSNLALAKILRMALRDTDLPVDAAQLIEDTSRESSRELMTLDGYVDALIPRGGKGLIQSVVDNATVPVIETGAGLCHIYVDKQANMDMALPLIDNAKTQRPSVCNAVETLLVHREIASAFLPMVAGAFRGRVELRACEVAYPLLKSHNGDVVEATEEDWSTEYLDNVLAVKVVDSLQEALDHIDAHSTHHSDVIVTENYKTAEDFIQGVDSAAVYVNVSSRFTDGGEFGLGAEIGISTQKLHVRGPMGLEALTTGKYVVRGYGQIRD